jgi:hypothetical protein
MLSSAEILIEEQKKLNDLADKNIENLESQVKKFEVKKLEQAKTVCIEYTTTQCEEKGIDFTAITISDLFTQLGSVTATGNISGKAKAEIDNRIQAIENQILKERLAQEEKLKHEREIAEKAREEAENRARQREQQEWKELWNILEGTKHSRKYGEEYDGSDMRGWWD